MKSPFYKSKQRIEQDLSRNAIADYESGDKKAAKYEKTEELEVAAGEGPKMMGKSPMKQNADFKYMPIIDREKDAMKKGDSAMKMSGKSAMKMAGESPMKMGGESPMKMGGSFVAKHSALKMMKTSPAKLYKKK